jgi:predicted RNA-binding Zn-ribbon protein involved in translation (DUF1610 family)
VSQPARLEVATTCPACAAPLDVVEGASSARCGHCGNRLLFPGRRRVLTHLVRPKTDAAAALRTARAAAPAAHAPELCLLPYYRYTAEELRWNWPPLAPGQDPADPLRVPELAERAIERNFLACAWDGLGLYSMGVRTTALRLELLRADALPDGARVVAVETPAPDALAHALKMTEPDVLAQRAVVGGVLSLVYFPFWVCSLGTAAACRFAVVDAVTGALVTADGPPHLRERLSATAAPVVTAIEPRVLLCPNCGWDLPEDPDAVVFYCVPCTRAWALADSRLVPIAHAVVPAPDGCASAIEHHPLWLVDAPDAPPAFRHLYVPAFRHRARRQLLTLATTLTRKASVPADTDCTPAAATAAYLDRDDALAFARFVAAGIDARRAPAIVLGEPRLVWWPFERLTGSLREPYTRFAIPASAPAPLSRARAAAGR